ncbi:hypothetical protein DWS26_23965 [Escherichia coli]|nr:hypothetical protein [Escherichia coli]
MIKVKAFRIIFKNKYIQKRRRHPVNTYVVLLVLPKAFIVFVNNFCTGQIIKMKEFNNIWSPNLSNFLLYALQ